MRAVGAGKPGKPGNHRVSMKISDMAIHKAEKPLEFGVQGLYIYICIHVCCPVDVSLYTYIWACRAQGF